MENKNKLDMSVIRKALKYNLVDGKLGIMNIDSITYEIKKIQKSLNSKITIFNYEFGCGNQKRTRQGIDE